MTAQQTERRRVFRLVRVVAAGLVLVLPACQQKMARAPYYRPYDETAFFKDGRSARLLEPGVVHRTQELDDSRLSSGLTPEARAVPQPVKDGAAATAEPKPLPGAANNPANFVSAIPIEIKDEDLRRGMLRYSIYCVECHGPLGNGGGKIVERGFLRPPSFHTVALEPNEPDESGDLQRGYSRGFARFGIKIPLREVPIGYIFEVISRGYGGMPDYAAQIPLDDRWRIAAYVRTLQFSQHAAADELQPADRAALQGGKK